GAGVAASDEEVGRAVAFAFRELKLVVEPGGAVGLAALLAGRIDVRGKIAVAGLSSGNADPELFSRPGAWGPRAEPMTTYESRRTIDGLVVTADSRRLNEHYEIKRFTKFGFE